MKRYANCRTCKHNWDGICKEVGEKLEGVTIFTMCKKWVYDHYKEDPELHGDSYGDR